MGKCIHCGENAGIFRKECRQCRQDIIDSKRKGAAEISNILTEFFNSGCDFDPQKAIEKANKHLNIDLGALYIDTLVETMSQLIDSESFEGDEVELLKKAQRILNISDNQLPTDYVNNRFSFGLLMDYLNGNSIQNDTNFNIRLLKSEIPFYALKGVSFSEERKKTTYSGGSTGYSFRVTKGFWIRQSAFKGSPVTEESLTYIDDGDLIITNKHIYFSGGRKAFRVKLDKIVTLTPYNNGLQIIKEGVTAKPMFFEYNRLTDINLFYKIATTL